METPTTLIYIPLWGHYINGPLYIQQTSSCSSKEFKTLVLSRKRI